MNNTYAIKVIKAEISALRSLIPKIKSDFSRGVSEILRCRGRLVVTGMGKAGIVGEKISATFASTGLPSLFLHPAEAYHGDLGRVAKDDIVLMLSNSGETEEIVRLLPKLKEIGTKIISITSSRKSTLGKYSDITLELGNIKEPCPWGIVPSASTTAMLALGDALALSVFQKRSFTREQFAFYHPGGELGQKLLKVKEVMRAGSANPIILENKTVKEALMVITKCRAGAISIVNTKRRLVGIFTDGDLRRHLREDVNILSQPIKNIMTRSPITISPDSLVAEGLRILRDKKIDELPVVDKHHHPVGMLDVQDILDVSK
ncbi:MAG: KpsF/GutQ family sugar-phosphate isomerase [Planctomycetota bacterium]|nr:KpsF/GutQ family sugar-phosphate isomerase [Planctomycetota bacterium]MDI6786812.1 KpsF/GutQ family sugar-phosphate isomerase [Planctomycetota bacterium]